MYSTHFHNTIQKVRAGKSTWFYLKLDYKNNNGKKKTAHWFKTMTFQTKVISLPALLMK